MAALALLMGKHLKCPLRMRKVRSRGRGGSKLVLVESPCQASR